MISKRLQNGERPVFPKRAVVTGGMPYGNKSLHFGHVGGMFIHADIFARFLRDRIGKDNVIFVSGTDCYGSPIMESYRRLQEDGYTGTIQDYVQENHEKQKQTLTAYRISPNLFGASALGRSGELHQQTSAEIFSQLYRQGDLARLSAFQFYDEERGVFLNGRQVTGKCPVAGCQSEHAYADECSLGHQYLPQELVDPVSALSGTVPVLKPAQNWYFRLEDWTSRLQARIDFLRRHTNRRKYELNTVEEFLKPPCLYVAKNNIPDLTALEKQLPVHETINEEKKPSLTFIFPSLPERDAAKARLDSVGIRYTSGKTLVPFRLSGNASWGVPVPDTEDLHGYTFWVWPESLWAPISFTKAYLEEIGRPGDEWRDWWQSEDSQVYQFIGEDNIYFYSIAETGLFTALQLPHSTDADMESVFLPHIIANRHVLFMGQKASSSSAVKPPMADNLLQFYTPDQLRMHFMSLGLTSKSVSFTPQAFRAPEDQTGPDPVLKEGNLLTNIFNRLIRSCFYTRQSLPDWSFQGRRVSPAIRQLCESSALEYERHMYNQDFHRVSYLLDSLIRKANQYWASSIRQAEKTDDADLKAQVLYDCFYACKIIAILVHPIAPEGCELFRSYLNIGEELWDWDRIFDPLETYFDENHVLQFLKPRVDFFKKLDSQYEQ